MGRSSTGGGGSQVVRGNASLLAVGIGLGISLGAVSLVALGSTFGGIVGLAFIRAWDTGTGSLAANIVTGALKTQKRSVF